MGSGFRYFECNALFIDDKLEEMGIEELTWLRVSFDLNKVIGFSEQDESGIRCTQVMLDGAPSLIIDTSFDEFKELLE